MPSKVRLYLVFLLLCRGVTLYAVVTYLDNGVVKIGVDINKGGTITYLGKVGDGRDMVNSFDMGRMVQQSYYSGPVPFQGGYWGGRDWAWNPVAAGNYQGYASSVQQYDNDGTVIYVKRIPLQWALSGGVASECTMEEWITLEDNVVKVRCRINNNRADTVFYRGFHQELPAIYTNPPFWRIFTYNGSSPFTNGSLTQIIQSGPPWTYFSATEHWTAIVDTANFGVGVYHPQAQYTVGGTAGYNSGVDTSNTAYVSPLLVEHIDYNIIYEYEYYLIVGSLSDIRNYVYAHRSPALPHWHFQKDRQHWVYYNAVDAGFPLQGKLRLDLNSADPAMASNDLSWKASDVPKIYIRASYSAVNTHAQLFWQTMEDSAFGSKLIDLFLIPDGQSHTYVADLSLSPLYTGQIKSLRFDPAASGTTGEYVDIEYISAYPFPGDFNRDGSLDLKDFAVIAENWRKDRHAGFVGDLDNDRKVDVNDLSVFYTYWLNRLENHNKMHLKLNETQGNVALDEVGLHHGQLINFPSDNSQWITGPAGGALHYDGVDDYVLVSHDTHLNMTHCVTISAWVKLNNLSRYCYILTKQPSGTASASYPGNFEFRIAPNTGKLELLHQKGTGAVFTRYESLGGITAAQWTHVAVTLVKGNDVRFYINGVLSGSSPQSGEFGILNSEPVRMGTRKDGHTYFNGAMDDVRLYNKALNGQEIYSLFEEGS